MARVGQAICMKELTPIFTTANASTRLQGCNYGFKDYKPLLGRWTTVDPICSGSNWYVYVNNDPVNWIDPLGLAEIIANDIHGNPIAVPVPTQESYLKARTNIEIQRNSEAVYYNDILSLNNKGSWL